jgi:Ras homolog gene family, member A
VRVFICSFPGNEVDQLHTVLDKKMPAVAAQPSAQSDLPMTGPIQERKLVIVGDGGCGKTSLLMVYTKKEFPEEYVPTVFENYVADVVLDKKRVQLALWDTAGQEDYDRLRPLSYPDTDVVVLCFALDAPASLENIQEKWATEVSHFCGPSVTKILVGLKSDLRADSSQDRQLVSQEHGQSMAQKIGAYKYIECSAKYGENVEQVFQEALRGIWEAEKKASGERSRRKKLLKDGRCTIG